MSGKRKRPGYQIGPWGRPVDHWRAWAAKPLPSIDVSVDHPGHAGRVYTLKEDGAVVGTWRHSVDPWLYDYLKMRLMQLHGAYHVAQEQLARVKESQRAGAEGASELKRKAALMDARIKRFAPEIRRSNPGISQKELAMAIEERAGGSWQTILRKLPKLAPKRKRRSNLSHD